MNILLTIKKIKSASSPRKHQMADVPAASGGPRRGGIKLYRSIHLFIHVCYLANIYWVPAMCLALLCIGGTVEKTYANKVPALVPLYSPGRDTNKYKTIK